jgi:hypothetical protein
VVEISFVCAKWWCEEGWCKLESSGARWVVNERGYSSDPHGTRGGL